VLSAQAYVERLGWPCNMQPTRLTSLLTAGALSDQAELAAVMLAGPLLMNMLQVGRL
jgi:hypothetical protein